MKRPKKWRIGSPFLNVGELIAYADLKHHDVNVMIWVGNAEKGRAESIAWTMNRALADIRRYMRCGCLSLAEVTQEYRDWLKHEAKETAL